MSDIADAEDISEDSVTVAVKFCAVCLDIVSDHVALQLSTLLRIETYIVGVLVPGKCVHIQLSGLGVGRLAVKPRDRLVRICHLTRADASRSRKGSHQYSSKQHSKFSFHKCYTSISCSAADRLPQDHNLF